jgi:hypothetical protein
MPSRNYSIIDVLSVFVIGSAYHQSSVRRAGMSEYYGIVITGFIALVALIAAFSDTRQRGGFKWFLVLLILAGAGAGGYREYLLDRETRTSQGKLDDAVRLAKDSSKLAEDEIKSHETDMQKFAAERERIDASAAKAMDSADLLIAQIEVLLNSLEKTGEAVPKTKKTAEIGEAATKTCAEVSKELVAIIKEAEWLAPSAVSKLEAWIKQDKPLKKDQIRLIRTSVKKKSQTLGEGSE